MTFYNLFISLLKLLQGGFLLLLQFWMSNVRTMHCLTYKQLPMQLWWHSPTAHCARFCGSDGHCLVWKAVLHSPTAQYEEQQETREWMILIENGQCFSRTNVVLMMDNAFLGWMRNNYFWTQSVDITQEQYKKIIQRLQRDFLIFAPIY